MDKVRQKRFLGRIDSIFCWVYVREKGGRKESFQAFFRQSTGFRRLEFIETRTKVHRLDEGYAHILKRKDFTEDPKEEISG